MRKTLTAAMAAITLGGAISAAAAPAEARDWGHRGGYSYGGAYGGHYYHHNNNNGAAVAAGVVGLALGAALASNSHSYYYDRPYYRSGYYDSYYAPAYRVCESERWVWDPYIHRRVPVRERYAC
jgi:hypothetical protein